MIITPFPVQTDVNVTQGHFFFSLMLNASVFFPHVQNADAVDRSVVFGLSAGQMGIKQRAFKFDIIGVFFFEGTRHFRMQFF